ncbi:hypothetical protein Tco_0357786 [Tanacetum coccineum]
MPFQLLNFSSSGISLANAMSFEGSSLSSLGMELAKSCEAKSLDSSCFREVTRSSVSWLISGYEGLDLKEATSALAFAFFYSILSF